MEEINFDKYMEIINESHLNSYEKAFARMILHAISYLDMEEDRLGVRPELNKEWIDYFLRDRGIDV